jgi:hypothetical protein
MTILGTIMADLATNNRLHTPTKDSSHFNDKHWKRNILGSPPAESSAFH